jgi:NAD(P)-dependent dehydrogenase (short-subunit alcohol dehydrogenase family)
MSAPIIRAAGGNPGEPLAIETSVIPLGRVGDDLDIAGAILHLASRAGAYCNGNFVLLDGGRLTTFPSTF